MEDRFSYFKTTANAYIPLCMLREENLKLLTERSSLGIWKLFFFPPNLLLKSILANAIVYSVQLDSDWKVSMCSIPENRANGSFDKLPKELVIPNTTACRPVLLPYLA